MPAGATVVTTGNRVNGAEVTAVVAVTGAGVTGTVVAVTGATVGAGWAAKAAKICWMRL